MTDERITMAAALAELQTQLPTIVKASKAQYGDYANLTDVSRELLPVLGKLGLSFTCMPTLIPGRAVMAYGATDEIPPPPPGVLVLEYTLRLAGSSEIIRGYYPLPQGSPQTLGSAITYARRYCLCAVTGAVAEEDDDGQAAEKPDKPAAKTRGKPPVRAAGNLPRNRDGSTARSQATDEELADTGQMTDRQLRDHNRLERDTKGTGPQGTERLTSTPADDSFYLYETPLGIRAPRAAVPIAGWIHNRFKDYGYRDTPEDRDARLQRMSAIVGRTLTSTNDLSASEGIQIKRVLEQCPDLAALDEYLAVKVGEATDA